MSSVGPHVDKLDGKENYGIWNFQMKLLLIEQRLWNVVNDPPAVVDPLLDQSAYAKICLAVKPICYPHVKNCKTAAEAWNNLRKAYGHSGISRRLQLKRKLTEMKLVNYDSMDSYIGSILSVTHELADVGCAIDDEEIAEWMLLGLSEDYDPLIMAIQGTQTKLSVDFVKEKLLRGELKRSNILSTNIDAEKALASTSSKGKFTPICHHCNKQGHIRPKCPKLKNEKRKTKKDQCSVVLENSSVLHTALSNYIDDDCSWVIDSGCTNHMSNRESWFTNFDDNSVVDITVANKDKIFSKDQSINNTSEAHSQNADNVVNDILDPIVDATDTSTNGLLCPDINTGVEEQLQPQLEVYFINSKTIFSFIISHTGGGPSSGMSLTALEERVVAVIGVSAVVGQAAIEEHGFNRTPNEPVLENATIEPSLGHSSASINTTSTPESSSVPRASQATSTLPPPSQPPQTPPPVPQTPPPPPTIQPPPSSSLITPPPHSNRQQVADSPRSATTTPRRALLRTRRNRGLTPFERVAHEFATVEQRRLAREESREMRRLDYEEARDRRLHEREMERLRLEAQRIEVARQTNELLHQLGVLAQRLIDVISQQGSLPSTDPI
ncbi:hypothetical protein ACJJTC_009249 [Scirpophaga incertulas]